MRYINLIILIVCYLAFGCTTSRGSLFQDVVEDDKPESETPKEDAPSKEDPYEKQDIREDEQGIYVTSYPDDAEVYINGDLQGYTPLLIEDLETGTYKLELSLEGYEPEMVWITFDEESYVELDFELSLITGFIELLSDDQEIELYIDGDPVHPGRQEWPVGDYTVRARKFGFEDYRAEVLIEEDSTTSVKIVLEAAVFALRDIKVSRKTLNPDNPGNLGKSSISFEVNTFGTGKLPDEKIEAIVKKVFSFKPADIIKNLDLKKPIFTKTASYGHFGRELPEFTWEKTDKTEELKKEAGL